MPIEYNKHLDKNINIKIMIKKRNLFSIFFLVLFFLPLVSLASSGPIVPQGSSYETGDYELSDLLQVGVNVTKIILGMVGSLTLLMFVYGGVMMLISAGNSEKVSQAKGILMAAVIGLIIVFSSYLIIQFVMQALGVSWSGSTSFIN